VERNCAVVRRILKEVWSEGNLDLLDELGPRRLRPTPPPPHRLPPGHPRHHLAPVRLHPRTAHHRPRRHPRPPQQPHLLPGAPHRQDFPPSRSPGGTTEPSPSRSDHPTRHRDRFPVRESKLTTRALASRPATRGLSDRCAVVAGPPATARSGSASQSLRIRAGAPGDRDSSRRDRRRGVGRPREPGQASHDWHGRAVRSSMTTVNDGRGRGGDVTLAHGHRGWPTREVCPDAGASDEGVASGRRWPNRRGRTGPAGGRRTGPARLRVDSQRTARG
jgi:hypothetical protein